jgi:hypothetical protein
VNYSTGGWGEDANCLVEDESDTRFIRKPTEEERKQWRQICVKCPVAWECKQWAERLDVHGVFVAGKWRE